MALRKRSRWNDRLQQYEFVIDEDDIQLISNAGVTYPTLVDGSVPPEQLPADYLAKPAVYNGVGTLIAPQQAWQFSERFSLSTETLAGNRMFIDLAEALLVPERGLAFSKTGAQEVTVTASMPLSSDAVVHVWDGSAWKARSFTGAKTINFTTTGAGALLSGSVASSTGYYLFPISTSAGSVAWIASTSASVSIGSLPGSYTEVGRWKWWVPTDGSSNIQGFTQNGNVLSFTSSVGLFVLGSDRGTGGLATTPTTVDATGYLPAGARRVHVAWTMMNNASAKTCTIYTGSGVKRFDEIPSSASANSAYRSGREVWDWYEGTPSAFFQYDWSATPGAAGGEQGLSVAIQGIVLHEATGVV